MKFRAGDVEAFGGIHRRLRGIGISSVISGFVIVSYYANIISWSCVYCVSAFISPLPWTAEGQGLEASCDEALAPETNYLYNRVLHLGSAEQLENASSEIIAGWVYGGLVVIFITCYFCIWRGVRSAGKVVYFTATAPAVLVFILFCYNVSLPGAGNGIKAYIGAWEFSALKDSSIWTDAAGQIFFTLGVSMGIMTAYGSYVSPNTDLVMDHAIITGTNSLFSIFSGFVIYAILGNVVHEHFVDCPQLEGDSQVDYISAIYQQKSISLAFIVYPRGLANFPTGVSNLMGVLFFFTLMNLGIDSAFSMVEGVTTVISDTTRFRPYKRSSISLVACGLAFLASTLFATDLGLYFLDAIDHYVNTFGLQLVGMMQCVAVGWVYGDADSRERVGSLATNLYTGGFCFASILAVLLCGALVEQPNYLGLAVGIPVGAGIFFISMFAAFATRSDKSMGLKEFFDSVAFCGTEKLRHTINENARVVPLSSFWDIMVKYMCPPILLGLLVVGIISDAQTPGGYAGYPLWLQMVSMLLLLAILAAFVINIFIPSWWETAAEDVADEQGYKTDSDYEVNVKGQLKSKPDDRMQSV
eukprot:scaffold135910_cov44-Prasinocladus_malaysianus.AAC.1